MDEIRFGNETMTRPYRYHTLYYCKTCGRYVKKVELHRGHDLWFSKERKTSALFESFNALSRAYELTQVALALTVVASARRQKP